MGLRIHVLPIEPFEERYTGQWYKWWPDYLRRCGAEVMVIDGDPAARRERRGGEFLDPTTTWLWKGSQVAELARRWENGDIRDGDWLFSFDGWGPASEAVPYMRDITGRKVRWAAFWHAGGHDASDLLYRAGCHKWSVDVERGWMKACDLVFCCSASQVEFMDASPLAPWGKDSRPRIEPIGNPVHSEDVLAAAGLVERVPWCHRGLRVVFPHRLAPEKQDHLWRVLPVEYRRLYGDEDVDWVTTRDIPNLSKADYYRFLATSRVCVSFALQENFGTAMNEATCLGTWNVAPNFKCYPETVVARGAGSLFPCWDLTEAAKAVHRHLHATRSPVWDGWYEQTEARAYALMEEISRGS